MIEGRKGRIGEVDSHEITRERIADLLRAPDTAIQDARIELETRNGVRSSTDADRTPALHQTGRVEFPQGGTACIRKAAAPPQPTCQGVEGESVDAEDGAPDGVPQPADDDDS